MQSIRPLAHRITRQTRSMAYFQHLPNEGKSHGYLFARKPGTAVRSEGWENIMYYGFFGTMALMSVGMWFKPDKDVYDWAQEEIAARKEAAQQ